MKGKTSNKTRGIYLPRALDQRLVEQARREERSVSKLVKLVMQAYLARAEKGLMAEEFFT